MNEALQLVSPPTPEEERRARRRRWNAAYYAKHPDRAKAAQARWYREHQDHAKARNAEYYATHRDEKRAYQRRYAAANPGRVKLSKAAWSRLSKYGLTSETLAVILETQGGVCAICRTSLAEGRGAHVDHDHVTGRVRGLLCNGCNTGIGLLRDSTDLLEAAVIYLRKASLTP